MVINRLFKRLIYVYYSYNSKKFLIVISLYYAKAGLKRLSLKYPSQQMVTGILWVFIILQLTRYGHHHRFAVEIAGADNYAIRGPRL